MSSVNRWVESYQFYRNLNMFSYLFLFARAFLKICKPLPVMFSYVSEIPYLAVILKNTRREFAIISISILTQLTDWVLLTYVLNTNSFNKVEQKLC